jgi:hypothetical protein
MTTEDIRIIGLPNEFVREVMTPWSGELGVLLTQELIATWSANLPILVSEDMISRNREWRDLFQTRFRTAIQALHGGIQIGDVNLGIALLVNHLEAWCCITNSQRRERGATIREAVEAHLLREGRILEMTDAAMREMATQFGTPRRFRTLGGIDGHYLHIYEQLLDPNLLYGFMTEFWKKSPWMNQLIHVLSTWMLPRGLQAEYPLY